MAIGRWLTATLCALSLAVASGCDASASADPAGSAGPTGSAGWGAPSAAATAAAVADVTVPVASAPADPPDPKLARVSFVGDLALALKVGRHLEARASGRPVPETIDDDYPFGHLGDRFMAADLLVGNLECVLSKRGEKDTGHNPFRCPLEASAALRSAGFDLLSVANNHAMDFGQRAFEDMLRNLETAGLQHFGRETFTPLAQPPVIRTLGDTKVGLLAYYWPPRPPFRDVLAARDQVDVLFVFLHWGNEDDPEPMQLQRTLSRKLIDAGVDVVVGTHAHVLQPLDWYRGKLIAYGLGNFVFSGMMHSEIHRVGALLEVDVAAGEVVAQRLIRIRLEADGAPRWLDDPSAVANLQPPD